MDIVKVYARCLGFGISDHGQRIVVMCVLCLRSCIFQLSHVCGEVIDSMDGMVDVELKCVPHVAIEARRLRLRRVTRLRTFRKMFYANAKVTRQRNAFARYQFVLDVSIWHMLHNCVCPVEDNMKDVAEDVDVAHEPVKGLHCHSKLKRYAADFRPCVGTPLLQIAFYMLGL